MDIDYKIAECGGNHSHHSHHDHLSDKKPIFLVNPEIIKTSKEISKYQEGCLSFPEIRADVARPKKVTVKYLDYFGEEQILEADDLLATCVQHEIDHLNGITFLDHLSKLKKQIALRKFTKLQNSQ
ncbi:MAG: peptide deformylase [Lentimonas sp.]|jgi:peptide deformylase